MSGLDGFQPLTTETTVVAIIFFVGGGGPTIWKALKMSSFWVSVPVLSQKM